QLDQMTSRAAARQKLNQEVESVCFVDAVKSLLEACCEGDVQELPWCSITLSDRINPAIASDKCISVVMVAALLMRGNVEYQHYLLGVICATFQLTKVRPEFELESIGRMWLSNGACDILSDLQEASCPVQTRKLAWDVAYVLVNCILKPAHSNMGFELDVSND